jgi:DNA-binding CsgD family transcriptional regulator
MKPDSEGRVVGLPGLSPLPTITSHARGAIFLGEIPSDPLVAETVFRDDDETKTDKARFGQNAALGKRTRKLFLKGDLGDGGQALLQALAAPVGEGPDVVGVVFNAVDDQIGSSNTGASVRLGPEHITGFKPALKAALLAGREVLLTADHGHSLYIDKHRRVGAGKTPRYVALAKGETAPEGFLEIDVAGLGGPPARRAFAWKTGVYLGGQQTGFHGGCSLEEMVVPMAWLSRGGLAADEPAWWLGSTTPQAHDPGEYAAAAAVTPLPVPHPTTSAKTTVQLSLFGGDAATLPLSSELLAKLTDDEKSVLLLLKENGSARASELATRLNKNPGRLNGLIGLLKRKLHGAGKVLFASELLPTGETMYRYTGQEKAP